MNDQLNLFDQPEGEVSDEIKEPKLIHADCLDAMRAMEADSIDAIVTDPPYGLEFMGKGWDAPWKEDPRSDKRGVVDPSAWGGNQDSPNGGNPYSRARIRTGAAHYRKDSAKVGQSFQTWCEEWAREALRVAKPGSHLVAFGGTRTFHRLACAIEDAGWEVRDCLSWLYGCLSEDTEILLDGKWEPYHKATGGSLTLCYDAKHDTYAWRPIERLYVYEYNDTAYRIESDATDQIVSRNHRCLVDRSGRWDFVVADELALEQEARVPVLEALSGLLGALPVPQSHASRPQPPVYSVRHGDQEIASQQADGLQEGDRDMRGVPHEHFDLAVKTQARAEDDMLSQVQRSASGSRVGEARSQGVCGGQTRGPGEREDQDDGRSQSSLEGRGDVQAGQGQLHRPEVRPVPCRLPSDGSEGRVRHGAQAGSGDSVGEVPATHGSGASCRSRHEKQLPVESDAVCVQQGPQAVRGEGFTKPSLARVEPFHYVGTVWCVKVPTGAFVARRNGKVFVTGNSGFPKSLDVSKAIDKAAGAEREVVGEYVMPIDSTAPGRRPTQGLGYGSSSDPTTGRPITTDAATDAARQWQGWGTALKPAWEPIILARKPLVGTVAANVLAHGTGALNIDATRIGTTDALSLHGRKATSNGWDPRMSGAQEQGVGRGQHLGRWPANVALGCACEGEAHDERCAVRMLDEQSGITKGSGGKTSGKNALGQDSGWNAHDNRPTPIVRIEDVGGASRFFYQAKASRRERGEGNTHPTVKPIALMRWLVRLVTPPGGTVLDPFAGSGTTLLAARAEGFCAVGIEREAEYVEIMRKRLEKK